MGEIVFWAIIRIAFTILFLWIIKSHIDFQLWIMISVAAVYVFVIHPTMVSYKWFEERNKHVISSTLCSSCKHFDSSAVLCMKYDKHPTVDFIPCEGEDWEPKT